MVFEICIPQCPSLRGSRTERVNSIMDILIIENLNIKNIFCLQTEKVKDKEEHKNIRTKASSDFGVLVKRKMCVDINYHYIFINTRDHSTLTQLIMQKKL